MFKNRIRLPFYLSKPQYPVEKNVFRKADGSAKLLSAIVRNTYEGKTDQLPEDWHRKLIIALSHDSVTIEDTRLLTDVVLDGEYSIDWSDFLDYPLAPSTFTVQVTPFDASNTNCQSCEEVTQLSLVDDYTTDVWAEGTTNEYPDLITGNDTICCYPFLIEIMSFNTLYFDSVTVDQTGLLTVVVSAMVPVLSDVLIATYRVTCENGGYDEANVYGNITGTDPSCQPVTNLEYDLPVASTTFTISWDEPVPAPAGGYNYYVYLSSDLVTPVFSGNTSSNSVAIDGGALTEGAEYTVVVIADCGAYDLSAAVQVEFVWQPIAGTDCKRFSIVYIPSASTPPQSASYMDCLGVVQNHTFVGAGFVDVCMLVTTGTETPVFFAASTPDITINYLSICS